MRKILEVIEKERSARGYKNEDDNIEIALVGTAEYKRIAGQPGVEVLPGAKFVATVGGYGRTYSTLGEFRAEIGTYFLEKGE